MDVTRYTLDNGLNVILQQRTSAPVVACQVWVGVGSADEEPHEAGLAHVHEHMLFKGTERRGVGELAREVEAAGGHINAFTSFDQTCYYVVMSSRFFESGLDILSDAIRHSSFDADELERELEVIQEEIKRGNDTPSRVVSQMLFSTTFQEHPYRLPVIGTQESVDSFERQNVLDFFNKHYRPSNTTVVLVGDFETDEARGLVDRYFGDWSSESYTRADRIVEPEQTEFRAAVDAQDLQENQIRFSFQVPDVKHPDIPTLDILGALMGHGDSSHLYQTIQRERELVNSIYAGAYTPRDAGLFMVGSSYQLPEERSHEDVTQAILEEVFRFREFKVAETDLERARIQIESSEIYGKQSAEGIATQLGRSWITTGDPEFEEAYYAALRKVTPDDIREAARTYFTPERLNTVLLRTESSPEVCAEKLEAVARVAFGNARAEAIDTGVTPDSDGFAVVEFPHGPRLLVQEDPSVETFSMRALTLGGLRFESPETNGLNALLSSTITRGTVTRSAMDIAREVESMAGGISGVSGRNSFGLSMSGLSRFFGQSFEIFTDVWSHATVPEEEFERERRLQIQNIRSRQDRLGSVNFDRFVSAFFGDYPYAMPTSGTEESVNALGAERARSYLSHLQQRSGLVLSVVGDVDAGEVAELTERYLVVTEADEPWKPHVPQPHRPDSRRLVVGDLEREQAFITVGFDAPRMADDRRVALEVLYAILSGQGGRLFYELRDRLSLAYSVFASSIMGLDQSAFTIHIGTSPEKIETAVKGIFREIVKLHESSVEGDEIDRAKRYLIGNHDIGLQKNGARAMSFALDELYGFGYQRTLDYSDRIEAVTRDDIDAIIETYLDPDACVVAITKPEATVIKDDLLDDL